MDDQSQTSAQLTGTVVNDHEVLSDYSQVWSRAFSKLEWPLGARSVEGALSILQVEHALLGPFCIPIDLRRRLAFKNHFYENGSVLFPVHDLVGAETFRHHPRPGPKLDGPIVVLGGPIDLNYYHWLFSWCSRLAIMRLLAPELLAERGLRFLVDVRAQREPFISHLRALGVTEDRIVWTVPDFDYEINAAILVTLPSQNAYHVEVLQALSRALVAGMGADGRRSGRRRRIWIGREQLAPPKRRIANMADLQPVLARFKMEYVVLEGLDPAAQIALFAEAELVVGVHGAGLANMIFCPPDCRILIIEKAFNVGLGLARTFSVLAQACGLSHDVTVVDVHVEPGVDYASMFNAHHQDVVVAPEKLSDALARLA